eukprot:5293429-Pyramimonas_sp.AAC.1
MAIKARNTDNQQGEIESAQRPPHSPGPYRSRATDGAEDGAATDSRGGSSQATSAAPRVSAS